MNYLQRNDHRIPKAVFFSGPDGVGKTTQALLLIDILRRKGFKTRYVWLRFNHVFTLPVLALFKVMSLRRAAHVTDSGVSTHVDLHSRRILQILYESTMLLDMILATFSRISIPVALGYTIICDRYTVDTVVDIMIVTQDKKFYISPMGEKLLRLGPTRQACFVMTCETEELVTRRPDLASDQHIGLKAELFKLLAGARGYVLLDVTGKSPAEVTSIITKRFGIDGGDDGI